MKDDLGKRMKESYELRTKTALPRRTYSIIRVDGKAFHTYTKNLPRPYDFDLMDDMDTTTKRLFELIPGSKLAYVQSDEISILLTDFDKIETQPWFDGEVQKITSVSASIATAAFNSARFLRDQVDFGGQTAFVPQLAFFDSRVFTIPDPTEVANYFIWRQQDAMRNSVSMLAQSKFSHGLLQDKSTATMKDMLETIGCSWESQPGNAKYGRCVVRDTVIKDVVWTNQYTSKETVEKDVERKETLIVTPPVFTQDREWLKKYIPTYE